MFDILSQLLYLGDWKNYPDNSDRWDYSPTTATDSDVRLGLQDVGVSLIGWAQAPPRRLVRQNYHTTICNVYA